MKWSFAAIGVFLLGVIGVSIIFLFQAVTTNNESDYYLLKEITEAAMIEAIDIPYYRNTGDLKIVKEKFVENFTRRFAESAIFTSEYTIKSYDIMEIPPKVSIVIDTGIGEFTVGGNTDEYGVKNKLDAILEYVGSNTYETSPGPSVNPYTPHADNCPLGGCEPPHVQEYYAIPSLSDNTFEVTYSLNTPGELVAPNIKNIRIEKVEINTETSFDQGELGMALLQNNLSYNNFNISDNQYMQFIDNYATNITFDEYSIHNCPEPGYTCDNINKYYIKFNGSISDPVDQDKSKAIFKYTVTWSYDEYKFS